MSTSKQEELERIESFEYARYRGADTRKSIGFADFNIGFPKSMSMEDRYMSYEMALNGPWQTTMEDQSKEFSK